MMKTYTLLEKTLFLLFILLAIIPETFAQDARTGVLIVETKPEKALVYIDDKFVGRTNKTLSSVEVGKHLLTIKLRKYLTLEIEITLLEGDTLRINEELDIGDMLSLNSIPEGALVRVNGSPVGATPIDIILKDEKSEIELTKDYYFTKTESIIIGQHEPRLTIHLDKKNYENIITTYPKRTSILIGDDIFKNGDQILLDGGEHDITIGREGFESYKGSFIVAADDEIQEHHFLIEPEKYRTKTVALLYSLILPGMGQRYLKRGGYEPILGAAGYGLLFGSYIQYKSAVKNYDLYLEETDSDARASLNDKWQNQKKQSETMLYSAGAIWLGGIIWTLFTDGEANRYNRVRTNIYFDNVTNSQIVGLIVPLK